jgi:glycosyltransferase involved in cell wall biosynthesis
MDSTEKSRLISVIIPTINRNSLNYVLDALNNQTRRPDEIIIMEDKERLGQGIMRNKGFEKSKGDLIVFLDDDTIPNNNWLEIFENNLVHYSADGISGGYAEDDEFLREIRMKRNFPTDIHINPNDYFGIGGNVMYKRECLLKCLNRDGYVFNPNFKYTSEDVELVWRLKSYDCKLVYMQNDVRHLKELNGIGYTKFQFIRGRGLYDLFQVSKNYTNKNKLGRSLLWNENKSSMNIYRLGVIFLNRILGPFDCYNFSKVKYFILFWFGEKIKSLGFVFQMILGK